MTDKSPREIERELEQERAELRGTIDEFLNRMTLEGAWNRAGMYMRENHDEFGQTLGRVVKEKPIAVGLVAIGMAWIMFGSSTTAHQHSRDESFRRSDTRDDAKTRARLGAGDFSDTSARGPTGPNARPDPWAAPSRTPASAPQAKSETGTARSGGTSTPATSTPTTTPVGASSSSDGTLSGSNETRGGTANPTTSAVGANPPGSSARSGGTTSTGSTSASETRGAGGLNTASRITTSAPKSSQP